MYIFSFTVCLSFLLSLNNVIKCSSSETSLSPDSKSLYHDIVNGYGLYKGFPKVRELGGSNFKSVVFGSEKQKLWLVEFYNSWCGHCHRFAPTWKTFGSDLYEWRNYVGVAGVDCSNDANNQLCRDMEVMYYPMIKTFPPNSDEKFLGEDFGKGTVDEMRKAAVLKLKSLHESAPANFSGPLNLKPVSDNRLETLWDRIDSKVKYFMLVFEPSNSTVGSELALDLSQIDTVMCLRVLPNNTDLIQITGVETGIVVVDRDLSHVDLGVRNLTRTGANDMVRQCLHERGIDVPLHLPTPEPNVAVEVDISEVMQVMQMEDEIKKKLQATSLDRYLFQLDLDTALYYLFNNEVPLHKNITGERLTALRDMLSLLIKYFPWGHQGKSFLQKLKERTVDGRDEVDGHMFRKKMRELESLHRPFMANKTYVACRGSEPGFRGYPCGLWKLFHMLTVQEEVKDRDMPGERPETTFAMAAYIKNFFTCSECSRHFTEMAATMPGNVTTQEDGVMWLWAAHNNVNRRLAGDQTEDPKHPKVQFPTAEACPTCRNGNGSWNQTEVKSFLTKMYLEPVFLEYKDMLPPSSTTAATPSATSSYDKSLRDQIYNEETGYQNRRLVEGNRSSWDFNVFDISLCVVLYVCSVAILILVCIKFIFKRTYRKKPYAHDVLCKV